MEVLVHPGMHKTGTSSIQATLAAYAQEKWNFPHSANGNLSALMSLVFEDDPLSNAGLKAQGLSPDDAAKRAYESRKRLENELEKAFTARKNFVFSAERISVAPQSSVERLYQFFVDRGCRPRVVSYVRTPVSYMQSAFQQGLKANGVARMEHERLWPGYRSRFEKLDTVFGRDNVVIKPFKSSCLVEGDVVIDFFHEMGEPISPDRVVRVNESLSLEACALLYAQRKLGKGFVQGFLGAARKNSSFVNCLAKLNGQKLSFSRSYCEPIIERNKKDLAWIEARIAESILDLPENDSENAISSPDDLLEIADESIEKLESLLIDEIRSDGDKTRDRLLSYPLKFGQ